MYICPIWISIFNTDQSQIYYELYEAVLKGQSGDNLLPYLVFIDGYISHYLNALDENVNCIGQNFEIRVSHK